MCQNAVIMLRCPSQTFVWIKWYVSSQCVWLATCDRNNWMIIWQYSLRCFFIFDETVIERFFFLSYWCQVSMLGQTFMAFILDILYVCRFQWIETGMEPVAFSLESLPQIVWTQFVQLESMLSAQRPVPRWFINMKTVRSA